jgi:uncharacterized membrane protein
MPISVKDENDTNNKCSPLSTPIVVEGFSTVTYIFGAFGILLVVGVIVGVVLEMRKKRN